MAHMFWNTILKIIFFRIIDKNDKTITISQIIAGILFWIYLVSLVLLFTYL